MNALSRAEVPLEERVLGDAATWDRFAAAVAGATAADVRRALARPRPGLADLAALLSPAAADDELLDVIARRAADETLRRFGRVIVLYVPLYLSNECTNPCTYCGFAAGRDVPRRTLAPEEIAAELDHLEDAGFGHVLLLTGEHPRAAPLGFIRDAVASAHRRFDSVSVEIYPLDREGYARLVAAGADGVTLYQETYHRRTYAAVHPRGPKADFDRRLRAPGEAAAAGMRWISIGALLGLADWRVEAMMMGLHGRLLRHRHWRTRLAIGFPRLRDDPGAGLALRTLTDRDLVQLVLAMRLFFPDGDLVLSTRERARLRDGLVGLGITRMSAGSRTSPGGYGDHEDASAAEQFAITDDRSLEQIRAMISARGCQPVLKDWDRSFVA